MRKRSIIMLGIGLVLALIVASCSTFENLSLGSNQLPGKGVTVRMGRATWDTGWFQAYVYKLLLEELGYMVEDPIVLENVAFYIFTGQGDVDFWANGWFPLHDRYFEYQQVTGRVAPIGYQVNGGALQGYFIDKATAENFGITNLSDLADPEIATLFDYDSDGKADLVSCNEGWSCRKVIEDHLLANGLNETVFQLEGDYNELMGETISRYMQGKHILFYTWTPNWTVAELVIGEDIMMLSVPTSTDLGETDADPQVGNLPGCLESPCNPGFAPNDIRVVANIEFLNSNPAAARLFEMVEIPLRDIADQNVRMHNGEDSDGDILRHAEEWLQANREMVDQWLAEARAAAN